MLATVWESIRDTAGAIGMILDVENGWFWLLIGIVALILEALSLTLVPASMGLAAILTAVFAFVGLNSFSWLLAIFIAISLVLFLASRPLANKLSATRGTETNVHALVGKLATVTQAIPGLDKAGYVKVGGEEWRALPAGDFSIDVGSRVVIKTIQGSTAYVVPETGTKEEQS